MTDPTATQDRIVELMVADGSLPENLVRSVVASVPEENLAEVLANCEQAELENAEFRARLVACPALTRVVCPSPEWRTAADRRDVAKRAVKIIEAFGAKHSLTAEALAPFFSEHDTVWASMTLHPEADGEAHDPRIPSWGHAFYGFRFRVAEAIERARADELAAAAARKRVGEDEKWAAQGRVRCGRCDGKGGANHWPGFTCYACDGLCTQPAS